jgi:hypothetical protein
MLLAALLSAEKAEAMCEQNPRESVRESQRGGKMPPVC